MDCDTHVQSKLIPLENALKQLQQRAEVVTQIESVDLKSALGRVLAEDISSKINVPPADNSAMDGYAFNVASVQDLDVIPVSQRICAGDVTQSLVFGTAARIFTGAQIPEGADTVVMQEACEVSDAGIKINGSMKEGSNIRRAGEDIAIDDCILQVGQKLRAQDLGLAASVGIATLPVYRKVKVAIFSTGDELQEPGEITEPGKIYNSNRYTLSGLLETLGCEVVDLGVVEDTVEATQIAMKEAAQQSDLVMTSGGVSVGEEDHVRTALESLGTLEMWRINIKPGKPLAFGYISDTPFLGMPGNPVSTFLTFCIIARPFILTMQGRKDTQPKEYKLLSNFVWDRPGARLEYPRARLNDEMQVELYSHQGSGVLTSTSWADGVVIIPANETVSKGDVVSYIPFTELFD